MTQLLRSMTYIISFVYAHINNLWQQGWFFFRIGTFHFFLLLATCRFLLNTNVGASEKGGGWYQSKAHIHSVFVATITEGGSKYFFYGSEPLKLFWYVHGPHLSEGSKFLFKITHVSKEIVFHAVEWKFFCHNLF